MSREVFCSILCLLYFGWSLTASSKPDDKGVLVWSRGITADFYEANDKLIFLGRERAGVTFLSENKLIVYVVEPTKQLSSRKSPEVSSAFQLTLQLVESQSGKTVFEKNWGTRPRGSAVRVTTGGVLIKTGGLLRLYSTDFGSARDVPIPSDPNGTYFTSVSASGRTIAVNHYTKLERRYFSHIDVFDAETLATRFAWDEYPPLFNFSISDNGFLDMQHDVPVLRDFRNNRDAGTPLINLSKQGCAAGGSTPTLISDEQAILRDCKGILLLLRSGKAFQIEEFDGRGSSLEPNKDCEPYNPELAAKVATSMDGRVVALSLPKVRIRKPLFDEGHQCLAGMQMAVYDLNRRRRLFTVDLEKLPKRVFDFALSPDGSRLVILTDHSLSVWEAPR